MLVAPTAMARQRRFQFATPDGFVSLKGDAGVLDLGSHAAQARAEAAAADAYAVKLEDRVIVATFVVQTQSGSAPLAGWQEYLERSLAATKYARDASVLPARTFSLDGVDCAFADVERVTGGVAIRERYFVLPEGNQWVFVKLVARAEHFDAAARCVAATLGVPEHVTLAPLGPEAQRELLVVVGAALILAAILSKWLGRGDRQRRFQRLLSPRARRLLLGLVAAGLPLVLLLSFVTDWRIASGTHSWTAYALFLFGGAISLANFYYTFVRVAVLKALGRAPDAIRNVSPIPLLGAAVVPGVLLAAPSALLSTLGLLLMLIDTGSLSFFVAAVWTDDSAWGP